MSRPKRQDYSASSTDWAPAFIAALRDQGTIFHAAKTAGIARSAVYTRRDRDPEFAQAMREALDDATDILEAEARRRAKDGSDALLVILLKAYRPERFKDRVEYSGQTRITVAVEELTDEQLAAIAAGGITPTNP